MGAKRVTVILWLMWETKTIKAPLDNPCPSMENTETALGVEDPLEGIEGLHLTFPHPADPLRLQRTKKGPLGLMVNPAPPQEPVNLPLLMDKLPRMPMESLLPRECPVTHPGLPFAHPEPIFLWDTLTKMAYQQAYLEPFLQDHRWYVVDFAKEFNALFNFVLLFLL